MEPESSFYEAVLDSPVIAAVKNESGLRESLACEEIRIVFILYGDICNIASIVHRVKQANKFAIVHVDLINGLASREITVDWLHSTTEADGVISTRQPFIARAKELHLVSILRVFLLDSIALASLEKLGSVKPDFIDVLPGMMPKIIRRVCSKVEVPVLAGGLISEKEDVLAALDAGALAISTTNQNVWRL